MKKLFVSMFALTLCAVLGLPASIAASEPPDTDVLVQSGQQAPDFSGMTTDNEQISLSSLRGKVVVLAFFATW